MRLFVLYCHFIFLAFLTSCENNAPSNSSVTENCNVSEIESNLTSALDGQSSSTDFTFALERSDGRTFSYARGSSNLDTVYKSASTSKWISAAIILWAVDQVSGFDLSDIPSDHYPWTMSVGDSLYSSNLGQLLSFTSGLQDEANCLKLGLPVKTFDNCINDPSGSIVSVNEGNGYIPNSSFHYSSSHLQVAGAMAVAAGSYSDWQSLFTSFKSSTGLLSNSTYSLPSSNNARLAGGMTWTGRDYMAFLRSIYSNAFLSNTNHKAMFTDQVNSLSISYSPAFDQLGEQWHYGYGVWLQCQNSSFDCSEINYYSSPGAYGAYPFINFDKSFFGIIAREGALGTFTEGISLFRSVQEISESWADCSQ